MKRFATLFLCILITPSSAFASDVYDINYDLDSGKVKIEGQAEKNAAVTLEILRSGKNEDNLKNISPEEAEDVIFHFDQILADAEGGFCFEFKLPVSIGTDTYLTRVTWGGENHNSQLMYVSPVDLQTALSAINSAENQSDMLSAINSGIGHLGYENVFYTNIDNEHKAKVAKSVLEDRGAGFANTQAFGEAFKKALALQICNQSSSQFTPIEAAEYFEDVLKLKELASYSNFDKQSEKVKTEILSTAVSDGKGNYSSIDEFRNAFEKKTVIYAINNINGYDEVEKILKDNNHILRIDFSDYNALKDKTTVDKQMAEKKFSGISDVVNAFNSLVANAKSKAASSSSSYSGGGGGGGGGASSGGIASGDALSGSAPITASKETEASKENIVSFIDIDSVAWARQSIERLAQKEIVQGKEDNIFEPDSFVTREEFVKMIVAALNIKKPNAVCHFNDVSKDAWYYPFVASAFEADLVHGISDDLFGSGLNITKQDIAAMLINVASLKGKSFDGLKEKEFKDMNSISAYALDGVKKLSSVGIINGTDEGMFEPQKNATRAEAAVMLDRFLEFVG